MGYRNYSTAKGHIVDVNGTGDFTTIGAALTAAVSGQTIFIRPGTYTENPTLKAGVDLCAFDCDALTPNVIINGECTATFSGTCSITGIELQTNSNFFLSVTGTNTTNVNLYSCFLNCLNNTGINFSATAGLVDCAYCHGNIATTGISLYSLSSGGGINLYWSRILNSGSSTTASTCSNGFITIEYCDLVFPVSSSGTGASVILTYSKIDLSSLNTTAVTYNSTNAGGGAAFYSFFLSGSASAISIGAGSNFTTYGATINSSNTNAITGSGTLNFSPINMVGTSTLVNTTTLTPKSIGPFITMPQQPAFSANAANQPAVTGDGTIYTVTFANSTQFDQDSNFSSATFTAPAAGKYLFCSYVTCSGVTGAVTQAQLRLVTTAQTYTFLGSDPAALAANAYGFNFAQVASMSAGDTASVVIVFSGAASKVVSVTGANTYFSGVKVA